jgi:hypothetical protein
MTAMRKFFALVIFSLLLNVLCFGQGAATGDLHVTVKDPKGNVVTNATITVRDPAKGFERSSGANTEGEYRIMALPPGKYTVTVDAPGFAKAEFTNATVTVGELGELPVTLGVA